MQPAPGLDEEALFASEAFETLKNALVDYALPKNIAALKRDLGKYRIDYDVWFHESTLHESGAVLDVVNKLLELGACYKAEDGAIMYRSAQYAAKYGTVNKKKTEDGTEEEAKEEAFACAYVLNGRKLDYPIFFDTEASGASNGSGRADGLGMEDRTKCAIAFCEEVKAQGYKPGVYASTLWYRKRVNLNSLKKYTIWNAHYGVASSPIDCALWQGTCTARLPGYKGDMDVNIKLHRISEETAMDRIRLIASDMDATFWTSTASCRQSLPRPSVHWPGRAFLFAAASGRPLYTLETMFPDLLEEIILIGDPTAALPAGRGKNCLCPKCLPRAGGSWPAAQSRPEMWAFCADCRQPTRKSRTRNTIKFLRIFIPGWNTWMI